MNQYYIGNRGAELEGPMGKEEILVRLAAGTCYPETLVWCEGMSNWKRIRDCFAQERASAQGGAATDVQQMHAASGIAVEPLQQSVSVDGEPPLPQEVSAGANAAASPSAQVGTLILPPPLPQGFFKAAKAREAAHLPLASPAVPPPLPQAFLSASSVFPQPAPPVQATVSTPAIPLNRTTPPPLPQGFVQATPAPPPLPSAPVMRMYYVMVAGRGQSGPYREDLLMKQVQTGACPPGSLIWTDGMPGWEPVEHYFKMGVGMRVKRIVQGAITFVFKSDVYYPHTSVFACLCRYFKISGRACRAEFWWFWLLYMICDVGVVVAENERVYKWELALDITSYLLIIPLFSALVRRMHDIGKSGIWCIIPLVNLFLAACPSEDRPNMYGERPAKPSE